MVAEGIADLPEFDAITCFDSMEHWHASPKALFHQAVAKLKPGGLFIFHTPNALGYLTIGARLVPDRFKDRLVYLLDGRSENDVFETHYKANTRKTISELAEATGFALMKIKMLVSEAGFMFVPPLAVPELVWIRLLMTKSLKPLRTTIIATLKKAT